MSITRCPVCDTLHPEDNPGERCQRMRAESRIADLERRLAESEADAAAMREALDRIVSYGMDVDPCPECEEHIEGDSGAHDDSCPFAWALAALSACADARKPR